MDCFALGLVQNLWPSFFMSEIETGWQTWDSLLLGQDFFSSLVFEEEGLEKNLPHLQRRIDIH